MANLEQDGLDATRHHEQTIQELEMKSAVLKQIHDSQRWRVSQYYYRFRDKMLPQGSRRRNAIKFLWRVAKLVWWTITFQQKPHFAARTDDHCLAVPLGYSVGKWEPAPHLAVICHIFYTEIADEFHRYFSNIPFPFDLFITTDSREKKSTIENVFSHWKKGAVEIRIVPNRGRDIAPKLIACRDVYDNYEFFLHVHTKKSPHHEPLSGWRSYLLETLLGSEEIVESIFESFRIDPKLGIVAPQHFETIRPFIKWGRNFKAAEKFARRMGVKTSLDGRIDFPSGSMFWARSAALKPLLDCNLSLDEFPRETNQIDGTLGHVIERLYFFSCERAGYRWIKILSPANTGAACIQRIEWVNDQNELSSFIKNYQYELLASRRSGRRSLLNPLPPKSTESPVD